MPSITRARPQRANRSKSYAKITSVPTSFRFCADRTMACGKVLKPAAGSKPPFSFLGMLVCGGVANTIGADMPKGTVKWFNSQKGYGFIQPQGGSKDVFVHISAVERAGLSSLNEGQVIEYEEVSNRGKTSAENLRVQR